MDHVYHCNGISFVWDMAKASGNLSKHGIAFETAATVFFDPLLVLMDASRRDETRDVVIGLDASARLLFVAHVVLDNDEAIRIISARRATREEELTYAY